MRQNSMKDGQIIISGGHFAKYRGGGGGGRRLPTCGWKSWFFSCEAFDRMTKKMGQAYGLTSNHMGSLIFKFFSVSQTYNTISIKI